MPVRQGWSTTAETARAALIPGYRIPLYLIEAPARQGPLRGRGK